MVKVSVILPVYGVAEYIEKCTLSLLAQTLDDMEFIFVDDHGPDDSIDIAKRTIAGHPREEQFRFMKPEHNLGAGMARNFAIPHAQGQYIAFVDSDDWVDPTMFEELYNQAVANGTTDLCCCQMQKVYPDGKIGGVLENPQVGNGLITAEKKRFLLTHYVSLFASFIYKKEFVTDNDIRFAEDRAADDSYFVSCAWMTAKDIAYVNKPFYKYLIRPGSVCTTKDSTKYEKRISVFDKLLAYSKKHGIYADFKEEIDFMYIKKGYLSSVTNYITNSTDPQKATFNRIYESFLKQVPDYCTNRYYRKNKSVRLLVFMLRHTPDLAIRVVRFWAKKNNVIS
ncbi:MAG: glycosyltransferase [Bacteroidales bacterium]|nr:glycosyltransferase [Bacteroidales bacterium]